MSVISEKVGYIYLRTHFSYDAYNAFKLGTTINLYEKNKDYITRELKAGYFIKVWKIKFNCEYPIDKLLLLVESLLQNEFNNDNINLGGGESFFKKSIIDKIEPFLNNLTNINYEIVSDEEIKNLKIINM